MPDGDELGVADLVLGEDRLQRVVPAILFQPGAPRRAIARAALPDARLSSLVARRSRGTADGRGILAKLDSVIALRP